MISLTPTKLRDYLTCPHLYKLKHIDRRGMSASSPALAFGRSVHRALDLLHRPSTEHGGVDAHDVEHLLRRCWEDAYADRKDSDAYFSSACDALWRYWTAYADYGETIACEAFMARIFTSGEMRFRLGCKADRVLVTADGTLEVIDYKTSSSGKVPTPEWLACDAPTFLYYVLARACYPGYRAYRMTLLNVLSLARVEVTYTAEQVVKNKREIVKYVDRVVAGEFEARACEACAWCAVREDCSLFAGEQSFDELT